MTTRDRSSRRHLLLAASAAAVVVVGGAAHGQPARGYDTIIRGGTIVDGSGLAPYKGDVAIDGGHIVAVGRLGSARAATTAMLRDASGRARPATLTNDRGAASRAPGGGPVLVLSLDGAGELTSAANGRARTTAR